MKTNNIFINGKKLILILSIFFLSSVISVMAAVPYQDCTIYGNCKPVATSVSINNNSLKVNDSNFLQGYTPSTLPLQDALTNGGSNITINDLVMEGTCVSDFNISHYHLNFLGGSIYSDFDDQNLYIQSNGGVIDFLTDVTFEGQSLTYFEGTIRSGKNISASDSVSASKYCNSTGVCKDLSQWGEISSTYNSTYANTTAQWNSNFSNLFLGGGYFSNMNGFLGKQLFYPETTNILAGANKRYVITFRDFTKSDSAMLFNNLYEEDSANQISLGTNASLLINLTGNGYYDNNGIIYPQGFVLVTFYGDFAKTNVSLKIMNSTGTWFNIGQGYKITSNNNHIYRVDIPPTAPYITMLQLNFSTPDASANVPGITEIEYHLTRPIITRDFSFISPSVSTNLLGVTTIIPDNNYILPNSNGLSSDLLVGYFKGNGKTIDSTGLSTGTWTGTERYSPARFGRGFELDGVSYIDYGDTPEMRLTTEGTASAWFYMKKFPAGTYGLIFSKGNCGSDRNCYECMMYPNANTVYCEVGDASGHTDTGASGTFLNKWNHVALTWNASTQTIYLNGKAVQSKASRVPNTAGYPFRIGSWNYPDALYNWNGTIDEVHVWNRSLSASEINSLYQSNQEMSVD